MVMTTGNHIKLKNGLHSHSSIQIPQGTKDTATICNVNQVFPDVLLLIFGEHTTKIEIFMICGD